MDVSAEVETIIFEAIDEANEVRAKQDWIRKDRVEPLVGPQSKLDSLALLNLVVAVEERINAKYGTAVDLAGLLASDPVQSPLRTVSTLTEHLGASVQSKG